jgi:hypothetical protein
LNPFRSFHLGPRSTIHGPRSRSRSPSPTHGNTSPTPTPTPTSANLCLYRLDRGVSGHRLSSTQRYSTAQHFHGRSSLSFFAWSSPRISRGLPHTYQNSIQLSILGTIPLDSTLIPFLPCFVSSHAATQPSETFYPTTIADNIL